MQGFFSEMDFLPFSHVYWPYIEGHTWYECFWCHFALIISPGKMGIWRCTRQEMVLEKMNYALILLDGMQYKEKQVKSRYKPWYYVILLCYHIYFTPKSKPVPKKSKPISTNPNQKIPYPNQKIQTPPCWNGKAASVQGRGRSGRACWRPRDHGQCIRTNIQPKSTIPTSKVNTPINIVPESLPPYPNATHNSAGNSHRLEGP